MTNIWNKFKKLTNIKKVTTGEVIAFSGNLSQIRDVYGQLFYASGTSVAIGKRAYIENEKVINEIPSLPEYTEWI